MESRKKILWLASWYPNLLEPLNGDFIERHAQAASMDHDIYVIHVKKSSRINHEQQTETEIRTYSEHCQSKIIYYKPRFTNIGWLEKLYSNYAYVKYSLRAAKSYIRERGKPHCVHVHIALKAGLTALLLKFLYKLPYIVSEQWTGLLREAHPNIGNYPRSFRYLWNLVMQNASACTAVSHWLGKAMQEKFAVRYSVIPNVVNLDIFQLNPYRSSRYRFIHISTLNDQKNPGQILEAVAQLMKNTNTEFEFWVFGEAHSSLLQIAQDLGISERVEFKGTRLQPELAVQMRDCNCLILYSRYETFGCVVIEANACGLPVIVSDIPTMHELVRENINGTFVPLDSPKKLAEKMKWMMDQPGHFNASDIRHITDISFSYEAVSKQFDEVYRQLSKGGPSGDHRG